jgi:CheY-like chemotaxis protein
METLQRFATEAARDFNNTLTVINGYAGLLVAQTRLPDDARAALQQIYAAGERAAAISRRLLLFGRAEAAPARPVDVNAGLRAFAGPLADLLGKDISLDFELAADVPPISADAGLLENLLTNLGHHARDAMRGRGDLLVRTRLHELGPGQCPASPRRPGRYACLSLELPGPALPADLLSRAFEPFAIPRRSPGDGLGLCLAVVGSLAVAHRGWAEAENTPAGSALHVFLPAHEGVLEAGSAATASPRADASADRGGETILLVEDEAPVREFARAVLQAASGRDALETWKWHADRIHLLVTDLVLPDDFDGLDLAARLRAEKPALPVLCTSGIPGDALHARSAALGGVRFIAKPYAIQHLAQAVRACIDHT